MHIYTYDIHIIYAHTSIYHVCVYIWSIYTIYIYLFFFVRQEGSHQSLQKAVGHDTNPKLNVCATRTAGPTARCSGQRQVVARHMETNYDMRSKQQSKQKCKTNKPLNDMSDQQMIVRAGPSNAKCQVGSQTRLHNLHEAGHMRRKARNTRWSRARSRRFKDDTGNKQTCIKVRKDDQQNENEGTGGDEWNSSGWWNMNMQWHWKTWDAQSWMHNCEGCQQTLARITPNIEIETCHPKRQCTQILKPHHVLGLSVLELLIIFKNGQEWIHLALCFVAAT